MEAPAAYTAFVVLAAVTVLAVTRLAPDVVFLGALAALLIAGVLTPAEALQGFANVGVGTIAVLYVVVAGLRETGGVHAIRTRLLGPPATLRTGMARVAVPVTVLSSFLNNTPVVAMLIPAVGDWARSAKIAPSKLLIPLSYAAILGGTITLIGTSTNLIVSGLLQAHDGTVMGIMSLAPVGIPVAIVGLAFLLLLGPRLLPERQDAHAALTDARKYAVAMMVEEDGPLDGATLRDAGLRHRTGLYVAEIHRDGQVHAASQPDEPLRGGDRLVFVGQVGDVVELRRTPGLRAAEEELRRLGGDRSDRLLVEAVVSDTNPLVGRSVRDGRFRNRYGAVAVAVARSGRRLAQPASEVRLRAGDTLLLEAAPGFAARMRQTRDFHLVSELPDSHPFRTDRALLAVGLIAAMVAVAASGLATLFEAALVAALAMLATRCLTLAAARQAVDVPVLITIGAAVGVASAVQSTGLAETVAYGLAHWAGASPHANLLAIYLATALVSALVTNVAAAALLFPIAVQVAGDLGVSLMPFAVAIMFAASASFATPIGYQTNLMVYGPGGYRFVDFLRIGLPMTVVTATVALVVIPVVWGLK